MSGGPQILILSKAVSLYFPCSYMFEPFAACPPDILPLVCYELPRYFPLVVCHLLTFLCHTFILYRDVHFRLGLLPLQLYPLNQSALFPLHIHVNVCRAEVSSRILLKFPAVLSITLFEKNTTSDSPSYCFFYFSPSWSTTPVACTCTRSGTFSLLIKLRVLVTILYEHSWHSSHGPYMYPSL